MRGIAVGLTTLLVGCGAPEPAPNTGGVEVARGLVVVNTDYQSTNVSLVSFDGEVLSPSFLSSASEAPGLSAPLSGDVVGPTQPAPGDEVVLIDRYPASVITWANIETGAVRAQLAVDTGFVANPHDYVEISPTKAYVPRYEQNKKPGRQPYDAGSDVLIVDPSVPEITGSIDLSSAFAGAGEHYLPRPERAVGVGNRVVVLLGGYTADFQEFPDSRLALLDTDSDRVLRVQELTGLRGCSGLAISPDATNVAVACSGSDVRGSTGAGTEASGVAIVEVGTLQERARFSAEDVAGAPVGYGVAFADGAHVVVAVDGREDSPGFSMREDRLIEIAIADGSAREILSSDGKPFSLTDVRCDGGACFVSDSARGIVFRWATRNVRGASEPRPILVDTTVGLPPRNLAAF